VNTLTSLALALVSVVSCAALGGCAADSSDPADEANATTASELGSGIQVPNPSGAYFVNVTANGMGCPAGTWDASISADGKDLDVLFSRYEAVVNPGQSIAISDCQISIDLRSPQGLSFAVKSFDFNGYASLDKAAMRGGVTAKYYFQGNPLPAKEKRLDIVGPYDNSVVFADDIDVADLVWSPCGTSRRLNAQTRVWLNNDASRSGSGSIELDSHEMRMRFDLAWRHC
jgi:hypothetical protein